MNHLPFARSGPGRFFRGNLHTHSRNSDGGLEPGQVCASYQQQGYDFIAVTDHFSKEFNYPITDTTPYRSDEFTTIIGAELHAPALENGQDWHILGIGLPHDFSPPLLDETGPELADRAIQTGAFVGLAHPAWYGATTDDLQTIPNAHAIEVYNEVCGLLSDKPESWFHADQLLAAGHRISCFGADDAHFRNFADLLGVAEGDEPSFSTILPAPDGSGTGDTFPAGFAAWVWVRAERLDPGLLVDALKAGQYYTSQGPRIHDVMVSDDRSELIIVNSPAVSVYLTGDPANFSFGANHGKHITRTTFPISAHHGSYCRVTVVDAAGKRAWTNPIWLD